MNELQPGGSEQEHRIELQEDAHGRLLRIRVTGRLTKTDYAMFLPVVERLIRQHGKIRILLETHDFHGWTAGALWEDVKFDLKHFNDIERLAIVGEKKWEHGMAVFCKPFTTATVRYFDQSKLLEADAWIREGIMGG
jgi:hypothetical protein